jgi:hypothetical protein
VQFSQIFIFSTRKDCEDGNRIEMPIISNLKEDGGRWIGRMGGDFELWDLIGKARSGGHGRRPRGAPNGNRAAQRRLLVTRPPAVFDFLPSTGPWEGINPIVVRDADDERQCNERSCETMADNETGGEDYGIPKGDWLFRMWLCAGEWGIVSWPLKSWHRWTSYTAGTK